MNGKVIEWDADKLRRFKKAYNDAGWKGEERFMFDGDEFFVEYAKYLIEYLEEQYARAHVSFR